MTLGDLSKTSTGELSPRKPYPSHWHDGELAIRKKLGITDPAVDNIWAYFISTLPDEHREHYTQIIKFLPLTIVDEQGRPWVTIVAKEAGAAFIESPDERTLLVNGKVWEGDPARRVFGAAAHHPIGGDQPRRLIAGIGLDLETRKRTKFWGLASRLNVNSETGVMKATLTTTTVLPNCPKYITIRHLEPASPHPQVLADTPNVGDPSHRLPEDVVAFIQQCDLAFLGTRYIAPSDDPKVVPSHVGLNHRGGRPGFIRVLPSDGRTVIIPDYSGDRILTSLGNIEQTPLAGLTFVDFKTGDVLYLTGDAKNVVGPDARKIMPLQSTLTTIWTTGYTFVRNATTWRSATTTATTTATAIDGESACEVAEPSPYSPPIKFLQQENSRRMLTMLDGVLDVEESTAPWANLSAIRLHTPTIATFTLTLAYPAAPTNGIPLLEIRPGQAAVLDFTEYLGPTVYRHLDPDDPTGLNDNRVRTWTISSVVGESKSREGGDKEGPDERNIELTIKEKEGGVVTGALFRLIRKIQEETQARNEKTLRPTSKNKLRARLVGFSGTFVLPPVPLTGTRTTSKFLWIAAGVGITPFLSMLKAVVKACRGRLSYSYDIRLVLVSRADDAKGLVPLLAEILKDLEAPGLGENSQLLLKVDLFRTSAAKGEKPVPAAMDIEQHEGRIPFDWFANQGEGAWTERKVYLCGPRGFKINVLDALSRAGVNSGDVLREDFDY